jgi:hypothetical protein
MAKLTHTGDDAVRPKEVRRAAAELVTTATSSSTSLRFTTTPSIPPLHGTRPRREPASCFRTRIGEWERESANTHPEWSPGQAEIAAAGGADRRSAKNTAAPMHQSREAHGLAPPLPRGGYAVRASVG